MTPDVITTVEGTSTSPIMARNRTEFRLKVGSDASLDSFMLLDNKAIVDVVETITEPLTKELNPRDIMNKNDVPKKATTKMEVFPEASTRKEKTQVTGGRNKKSVSGCDGDCFLSVQDVLVDVKQDTLTKELNPRDVMDNHKMDSTFPEASIRREKTQVTGARNKKNVAGCDGDCFILTADADFAVETVKTEVKAVKKELNPRDVMDKKTAPQSSSKEIKTFPQAHVNMEKEKLTEGRNKKSVSGCDGDCFIPIQEVVQTKPIVVETKKPVETIAVKKEAVKVIEVKKGKDESKKSLDAKIVGKLEHYSELEDYQCVGFANSLKDTEKVYAVKCRPIEGACPSILTSDVCKMIPLTRTNFSESCAHNLKSL